MDRAHPDLHGHHPVERCPDELHPLAQPTPASRKARCAEPHTGVSPPPAGAAASAPAAPGGLRFDRFQIHPAQRTLLEDGKVLRLGSRAFDLLVALCERAGEVVSTRELLAAAWPNAIVEEGSVRVHIASLRKVLKDGSDGRRFVTNVPLRGYCFVAPVEQMAVSAPGAAAPQAHRLAADAIVAADEAPCPTLLTGLVGRDREAAELMQLLHTHRCVTLVGAGGIGKTSVALPVARAVGQLDECRVVAVELAALSQPELVPMAIASALGVVVSDSQALPAIAAFLRGDRRLLLVLDNCEHVIDSAAAAAEHILSHAPGVRILATSREALRIQGEWVHRLESLALPPPQMQFRATDALAYPAVRLFVERAAAGPSAFRMGDAEAPLVSNICRRLDGIPLAIELAAGAIDAVGLKGLVERLGSRLGGRLVVIGRGRRTALPRHQTLRATLDWSYDLLPTEEQELLAQLSVFRSVFAHAAALAVFDRPIELLDTCLAGLVSKSLVVREASADAVAYRLLETTREYAAERLAAGPAGKVAALRHAKYMLGLVRPAAAERDPQGAAATAHAPPRWIDDLRAAIHWAFESDGARHMGVSLLAWSVPVWLATSMLAEYRQLAERAIACIDAGQCGVVDAQEEMRLCETLGHAIWHTRGGGSAMEAAFKRALEIAQRLQAAPSQLRCLFGLWLVCNAEGDYLGSLQRAEQFGDIAAASKDASVHQTHERMMALGAHFQGDQALGGDFAQRVVDQPVHRDRARRVRGFQFDQRVAGLTVMARVRWMQGHPDQALAHASEAVQEALSIDHPLSLCYAIAIGAAPVAFWCGEDALARQWSAMLKRFSDEHSLLFWQSFGEGYRHLVDPEDGRDLHLRVAAASALGTTVREVLCTVQPAFLDDALLARAHQGEAGWCGPELLRAHGERLLQAGAWDEAAKEFRRGIALARQQKALSWELRGSTSLARLLARRGGHAEALRILDGALGAFQEGHGTRDLKLARHVIAHELAASAACKPLAAAPRSPAAGAGSLQTLAA